MAGEVRSVFTDRRHGDLMVRVDAPVLAARRAAIVDRPWSWLRQVHGADVLTVAAPGEFAGTEADAAVTAAPGAVLAVQTADCAPVLFTGPGVIGVAHAGWRGLTAGVLEATAQAMAALGGAPQRAVLGPCIRARCYEFGGADIDVVAERYGVSRESQDEWAVTSQNRAVEARESGHFDAEIVGVTTPDGTVVTQDDGPRPGTTIEKLAALNPAFKPDGTVTAGNACPLNDGAAATLIMSEEKAAELGLKPRARIVASTVAAIEPEFMGVGPIPAIRQLLDNTGMSISDVDIVEINEAFAAQIVPCMDELGIDADKLNPFGGAIALGHPFGMTGARIMTTLLNGLDTRDGEYGIESMCVAGGMGQAMLVQRLS